MSRTPKSPEKRAALPSAPASAAPAVRPSRGLAAASRAMGKAARDDAAAAERPKLLRGPNRTDTAASKPKPATRQGKKGLVLYVDPEVTLALRLLALEHKSDVQKMGRQALELLFAEYGKALPGGTTASSTAL